MGEKMLPLQSVQIRCPYCGEPVSLVVDCSVERQEYIEDCSVCCRPITIAVVVANGEVASIEGRSENE
jgi:hypothetical protein